MKQRTDELDFMKKTLKFFQQKDIVKKMQRQVMRQAENIFQKHI